MVLRGVTAIFSRAMRTSASARVSTTALFSRATMSDGVPAGATRPVHSEIAMPDTPASASVGTSGKAGSRLSVVMASARSLPALSGPEIGPVSAMVISTWPEATACAASPLPR